MLRLCSDSSRSYPGRSVRIAVPDIWGCALHEKTRDTSQFFVAYPVFWVLMADLTEIPADL